MIAGLAHNGAMPKLRPFMRARKYLRITKNIILFGFGLEEARAATKARKAAEAQQALAKAAREAKRLANAGWGRARKATIARDGHACRKCGEREGLEVHHILERCNGGTNEIENLITLCSDCHCEWTFCQPPDPYPFAVWLTMPPARMLVVLMSMPWPADKTAAEFRIELLDTLKAALVERHTKAKPG